MVLGAAALAAGLLAGPVQAGHGGGGHGGGGHGGGGHGGGGFHAGGFHAGGFHAAAFHAGGFNARAVAINNGRFVVARRFSPVVNFNRRFFGAGLFGLGGWGGWGSWGWYYPYSYYYPEPAVVTAGYYSPAVVPAAAEVDESVPEVPPSDGAAHLMIRVPADAELWFDGAKTQQTGTEREFASPPLEPGRTYTYKVTARWKEDGRVVERKRDLKVRADMWAAVDLTQAEVLAMPKAP
jgi:uncharacterized protein (TIGR03000 family)